MIENVYAITVPKWGIEMQEGNIVEWHKEEGNQVNKGDELVDVETDKIVNTMEVQFNGVLRRKIAEEGETLRVGALLGVIAAEDVDVATIDKFILEFVPAEASFTLDDDPDSISQSPVKLEDRIPKPSPSDSQASPLTKVRISPSIAQRARELDVDISKVAGSGRAGRITREDVEAYSEQTGKQGGDELSDQPFTSIKLGPIRKIIAKRLQESKQSIPHFYLTIEVCMDEALEYRDHKNSNSSKDLSVNDIVVRATILALQDMPELNIHLIDEEIRQFKNINLAIAVATDKGLLTPVVKQAEEKSLSELSETITDLSTRARNNTLNPGEMRDATFTISNLGMFGVTEFQAIINPPQGAILAIGAVRRSVVLDSDAIETTNIMSVSLSCDHRAIDGVLGAKFLARLKEILEHSNKL